MDGEMNGLYDLWNEQKKVLAVTQKKILFKEGDIWWCSLGLNIGTESYGKGETFRRPVLIIKKLSGDACITLPLTSKQKIGTWFAEITVHQEKKSEIHHPALRRGSVGIPQKYYYNT